MPRIQVASTAHFPRVLQWLKEEHDQTGEGFYCNRKIIAKSFAIGEGLCAVEDRVVIGFAVFQMFTDGGDVQIIEVHPSARRRGLGAILLSAAVAALRQRGAHYAEVECTSPEGEAMCRRHGFQDYVDPHNHRSEWDNPTLRLYFSDWRPPARHPYA